MHNCKDIKERFTELVLDGVDCRSDATLSRELARCADCRDEFEALSATLRMTNRAGEMTTPAHDYWLGYHAKLRQRLESESTTLRPRARPNFIVRLLKTSVPVPLPVGVALIVAVTLLVSFAIRASRKEVKPLNNTTIVRVPVEVPVVQEKVVTRVVYRDRRSVARTSKQPAEASRAESTFAQSQTPAGLTGFKPSEEIKLTVIKGGVPNEK